MENDNRKFLEYLIKKETDLISSQNLAPFKEIRVIMGHQNSLQQLLFACQQYKDANPNALFFAGILIADDATVDNLETSIEAFNKFDFILFNNSSEAEQLKTVAKYAPLAKLDLTKV